MADLRRFIIASQGFSPGGKKTARPEEIASCIERLSCVQLDSVATVERSHLLVLSSRLGRVDPDLVWTHLETGRLFEYWAHEACLIPMAHWPLFRHRMDQRQAHHWWGPLIQGQPELAQSILDQIRKKGPQGSRHFEGRGGGGMWNLKPAKKMLDALWTAGELVISGRQGFQRLYDLPERVIPAKVRKQVPPSARDALKTWIVQAVKSRGALTQKGILDHYRIKGESRLVAQLLGELRHEGILASLTIEEGGKEIWVSAKEAIKDAPDYRGAVFLSPFENMLWDREFTLRVFGFHHIIEIYKKPPERAFGYYVLPLLVNDRLVGRADLKTHRASDLLELKAFHWENGIQSTPRLIKAAEQALFTLAHNLSLARVKIDKWA